MLESLRKRLNEGAERVGNRIFGGLGDLLNTDISVMELKGIRDCIKYALAVGTISTAALVSGCNGGGNPEPTDPTPHVSVSGTQNVTEKDNLQEVVTATSPVGGTLTITNVTGLPAGATFTSGTPGSVVSGTFDFTPGFNYVAGFDPTASVGSIVSGSVVDDKGHSASFSMPFSVNNRVYEILAAEDLGSGAIARANPKNIVSYEFDGQNVGAMKTYVTNSTDGESNFQWLIDGDVLFDQIGPLGQPAVYTGTLAEGSGWLGRTKISNADAYGNAVAKTNSANTRVTFVSARDDGVTPQTYSSGIFGTGIQRESTSGQIEAQPSFDENENIDFSRVNSSSLNFEIVEKNALSGLVSVILSDTNYDFTNPIKVGSDLYAVRTPYAGGDSVLCKNGAVLYTPSSGWSVKNLSLSTDGRFLTCDAQNAAKTLSQSDAIEIATGNVTPITSASGRSVYPTARKK